ncbi:trypsin-like cysteine/serine peptidase domain-containing protein [Pavlovales sp. CCMP2436]|nr:trypsin-like cysteine/serine peptidase domain-containing protein [Pavlovales sp. CCMP2436]
MTRKRGGELALPPDGDAGEDAKMRGRGRARIASPAPRRPRGHDADSDEDYDSELDGEHEEQRSIRDAVFRLIVTHVEPNYSLPWQQRRQSSSTSTAFLISGNRILTNAHCVENETVVRIKKRGDDRKFIATVVAVGRECDLAMLHVADLSFFEGVVPIELGKQLPRLQDTVTVVGYPVGGDNQSITQGVVSRIDLQEYSHGSVQLLSVQIDAAINSGNSGGPVLASSPPECVGIAFQAIDSGAAESIGYLIPVPVVERFLTDVSKNGRYTGYAGCGYDVQHCENPSLRHFQGMKKSDAGVRVMNVHPLCAKRDGDKLRAGDIITHFDSTPIANDGTVVFNREQRISWRYLLSQKFVEDTCLLSLLRDGKRIPDVTLELQLSSLLVPTSPLHGLLPPGGGGAPTPPPRPTPSFAIVGGLVFVSLSEAFLRSEYGEDWESKAPICLMERVVNGLKTRDSDEVVVLSQVLAHAVNVGYETIVNAAVASLNGQKVSDLRHLVRLAHENTDKFLHFDLPPFGEAVVLDAKEARAAEPAILAQHNIPSAMSPDLLAHVRELGFAVAASEGAGRGAADARGGKTARGRARG